MLKPHAMTSAFAPKSDLVHMLLERGYLHQCTNLEGLDARAAAGPITGYIGFDATADSLHVGSLVQIMMLRWMQRCGHKPIALMGGGTTKVGDPSGKDTQRQLLTDDQIRANIGGIRRAFEPFLRFGDGAADAIQPDNAEWLEKLGYVDFLRDYGVHFTLNRMLTFDSVKLRLEREQPLTFLEFNYMLMQAVDFLELHRRYGCALQLGGSDQWGNIVNGVDLVRRIEGAEVFGFTTPLITTASGAKMGKTAAGAVWLNPDRLSPYDYWQFWRNTEDGDVGRFLRLFTELPLEEIARLESLGGAEINEAKKVLANEASAMLHGREAAQTAADAAKGAFEEGRLSGDLPTVEIVWAGSDGGFTQRRAEGLVLAAGLATSLREARDLINGGGIQINDQKPTVGQCYDIDNVLADLGAFKVQKGKKKIVLLRPV
jgi:tyrosyl-tRNA synthetase